MERNVQRRGKKACGSLKYTHKKQKFLPFDNPKPNSQTRKLAVEIYLLHREKNICALF